MFSLMSLAEVVLRVVIRPQGGERESAVESQRLLRYGNTILGLASALDRKLGTAVYSTRRRTIYVGSGGPRKRPRLAAERALGQSHASARATASGRRPPEPCCFASAGNAAPRAPDAARTDAAAGTGTDAAAASSYAAGASRCSRVRRSRVLQCRGPRCNRDLRHSARTTTDFGLVRSSLAPGHRGPDPEHRDPDRSSRLGRFLSRG